jgi:hypothetical protein
MGFLKPTVSTSDDHSTVHLEHSIQNDLQAASGRNVAFTQNQRYDQLDDLKMATKTSDFV